MMGVEGADVAAFQRYGAALGSALDGVTSIGQARRVIEANTELERLFQRLFEERAREPREDLVSVDRRRAGPRDRAARDGADVLAAAHRRLRDHGQPHRQRDPRAPGPPGAVGALREDPSLAPAAVEETLRWDPPVQETARISFDDTEIGGVSVRRNQAVILLLAAAGRDPEVFSEPGTGSTSAAPRRPSTWRSRAASTTAWGRRWRASRPSPRSPP